MVRELAAIQKTILDVCAVYVKPGGALIYSTCTIDRIENEENVTAFLKAHEEYELESLSDYMPECLKKRAEKGISLCCREWITAMDFLFQDCADENSR